MNISYTRPKLVQYQLDILNAPERYTITEAGTKTGKTASHIVWLLEQALPLKNNQSVWWVAPTYSQAEIAYRRIKHQTTYKELFKTNEQKLRLTLPTGAMIEFKSAERPDNLYGDDVYAAVFDEFTRAREEAWFALRSTITKTNGKVKLIGNAKGKKNWGHRLGLKAKQGEKDYRYFKITAWDAVEAGILDKKEVEQAQRDLPDAVFKELYLAEPSEDGSNPFGLQAIRKQVAELGSEPLYFGIDLAKSTDHTVIIGLNRQGQTAHFERFQSDWGQTRGRIKQALGRNYATIDATGVGDPIVEELQRESPQIEGFKFTAMSKQQIMEGLASAIQQGKITYPNGVIVDELESFEYEYTRLGARYSAPQGLHDDCVCALALAWKNFNSFLYATIDIR